MLRRAAWLLVSLSLVLPAGARQVRITLLHTTDLHGSILPRDDYDGNAEAGGLLRLSTLVKQARAANPNTLLVDCGDFIQGSPETLLTKGDITVRAMGHLDYDAVVLGNHEFDWGLDYTRELVDRFPAPLLAANAVVRKGEHPLPKLGSWVLKKVDGVHVAIVGLTTPAMPLWFRPEFLGNLEFEPAVEALRRIMPEVREAKPDVVVLITHMGYRPFPTERQQRINQVRDVIEEMPEFDLICGGHTHMVVASLPVRGMTYAQAGYFGIRLGVVEIEFDTVRDEITRLDAGLRKVDATVPFDPELEALLREDLDRTEAHLLTRLTTATSSLHGKADDRGQSPVQQILAAAIARAAQADLVLHGVLDDDAVVAPGPFTEQDLWNIVPYENRIGVARLTPVEIRVILEESAGYGGHRAMGLWGGRYEYDPDEEPGRRVSDLLLADGSKPHGRKRYRVAFNSHVLSSAGGRYPELRRIVDQPVARLEMLKQQTRAAVRSWLRDRETVGE